MSFESGGNAMIRWGELPVENHRCIVYSAESVSFWIAREDDEWQFAFQRNGETFGEQEAVSTEIPDGLDWTPKNLDVRFSSF